MNGRQELKALKRVPCVNNIIIKKTKELKIMTTLKSKNDYSRRKARKLFKKYHNVEIILKNWHVHHVDLNPLNQDFDYHIVKL